MLDYSPPAYIPCLFLPYLGKHSILQNEIKSKLEAQINFLVTKKDLVDLAQQNRSSRVFDRVNLKLYEKSTGVNLVKHIQFTRENRRQTKLLLFFHGNAEDLGQARAFLSQLRQALRISILAVEYPGYGLYPGQKSADAVLKDALSVYDYIVDNLGVAHEDIILFGRSLGSSPSCYIAKKRP